MPPGTFCVISGTRPDSVGGGSKSSMCRPHSVGGGVVAAIFPPAAGTDQSDSGTFSGHLEITRHLWTLTQITGDLAGMLAHSKNVTTSIHCTKETFNNSLGGHGPPGPPGYATAIGNVQRWFGDRPN